MGIAETKVVGSATPQLTREAQCIGLSVHSTLDTFRQCPGRREAWSISESEEKTVTRSEHMIESNASGVDLTRERIGLDERGQAWIGLGSIVDVGCAGSLLWVCIQDRLKSDWGFEPHVGIGNVLDTCGLGLHQAQAFIGNKEECAMQSVMERRYGTARGSPEIILAQGCYRSSIVVIEPIISVEVVVAQIIEYAS